MGPTTEETAAKDLPVGEVVSKDAAPPDQSGTMAPDQAAMVDLGRRAGNQAMLPKWEPKDTPTDLGPIAYGKVLPSKDGKRVHPGAAQNNERDRKEDLASQERHKAHRDDLQKLRDRMAAIDAFKECAVPLYMENYVRCLYAGQDGTALFYLKGALDELDRVRAFEIPFHLHNRYWSQGRRALAAEATRRTQEVHLWSKMTQLKAMEASEANGISLEGSLGGWLFDGLSWGVKASDSRAMAYQWTGVSERFAHHAGGTETRPTSQPAVVHAHVLMGIPANSVLYTTEWKTIEEKMKDRRVEKVVVHRYIMDGLDGSVAEHDKAEITGDASWKAYKEESRRQDDWRSGIVVRLGKIKTANGERYLVARLALYMNDQDWSTVKYYTVPSEENRKAQAAHGKSTPKPGDPFSPANLSPLYTSRAKLDEDSRLPESYEMLGVQNLVQQGEGARLKAHRNKLWAQGGNGHEWSEDEEEANKVRSIYLTRLGPASEHMGAGRSS